jgi:hypothetical protein
MLMATRSATSKPTSANVLIARAVTRHALGEKQTPTVIGPLEVTASGLVLHLASDAFVKPVGGK